MAADLKVITVSEFAPKIPAAIKRPCDWGLERAVSELETQLGTIEAFNRLVIACEKLGGQIGA